MEGVEGRQAGLASRGRRSPGPGHEAVLPWPETPSLAGCRARRDGSPARSPGSALHAPTRPAPRLTAGPPARVPVLHAEACSTCRNGRPPRARCLAGVKARARAADLPNRVTAPARRSVLHVQKRKAVSGTLLCSTVGAPFSGRAAPGRWPMTDSGRPDRERPSRNRDATSGLDRIGSGSCPGPGACSTLRPAHG